MLNERQHTSDDDYIDRLIRTSEVLSSEKHSLDSDEDLYRSFQTDFKNLPKEKKLEQSNKNGLVKMEFEEERESYFKPGPIHPEINYKTELLNELYKEHLSNLYNNQSQISQSFLANDAKNSILKVPDQIKNDRRSKIIEISAKIPETSEISAEHLEYIHRITKEIDLNSTLEKDNIHDIRFDIKSSEIIGPVDLKLKDSQNEKQDGTSEFNSTKPMTNSRNSLISENTDSKKINRQMRIESIKMAFQKNQNKKKQESKRYIVERNSSSSDDFSDDQPTFDIIIAEDENGNQKLGVKKHDDRGPLINSSTFKPSTSLKDRRISEQKPDTGDNNKQSTAFFEHKYIRESEREMATSVFENISLKRDTQINNNRDLIRGYLPTIQDAVLNLKPVFTDPKFKALNKQDKDSELKSTRESTSEKVARAKTEVDANFDKQTCLKDNLSENEVEETNTCLKENKKLDFKKFRSNQSSGYDDEKSQFKGKTAEGEKVVIINHSQNQSDLFQKKQQISETDRPENELKPKTKNVLNNKSEIDAIDDEINRIVGNSLNLFENDFFKKEQDEIEHLSIHKTIEEEIELVARRSLDNLENEFYNEEEKEIEEEIEHVARRSLENLENEFYKQEEKDIEQKIKTIASSSVNDQKKKLSNEMKQITDHQMLEQEIEMVARRSLELLSNECYNIEEEKYQIDKSNEAKNTKSQKPKDPILKTENENKTGTKLSSEIGSNFAETSDHSSTVKKVKFVDQGGVVLKPKSNFNISHVNKSILKAKFELQAKNEHKKPEIDKIKRSFEDLSAEDRYKLEIEYKNKVMLAMNQLLERKIHAKPEETYALLREIKKQMVGVDFLYFCSILKNDDLKKISRFQTFYRRRIMNRIMHKIRFSNLEFMRLKCVMQERRTQLAGPVFSEG